MRFGIRAKIVLITSSVLSFALIGIIFSSSYLYSSAYTDALQARALAGGTGLSVQLGRLLELKLPIKDIIGFEEQCEEVVKSQKDIDFAMVFAPDGKVLFHSDAQRIGDQVRDAVLLHTASSGQVAVIRYVDNDNEVYAAVIPVRSPGDVLAATIAVGFSTLRVTHQVRRIQLFAAAAGLFSVVAAIALLLGILSISVTAPLGVLIQAVERVRDDPRGDVVPDLNIRSNDEIGDLARSFASMARRLGGVIDSQRQAAAAEAKAAEQAKRSAELENALTKLQQSQKESQELLGELRGEHDFSKALIDGLPGAFIMFDESGHIVRWNENLSVVTGLSDQQLQKVHAQTLIVERDREMAAKMTNEAFRAGHAEIEVGLQSQSGEAREYHWSGRTIARDGHIYLLGIGIDLTEMRAAERRLRASEERFRTVSETAQDAIIIIDPGGRLSFWNNAAELMFGYNAEEAIGKAFQELLVPPRFRERAITGMWEIARTGRGADVGKKLEFTATRKNGAEIPIELSVSGTQVDEQWQTVAILRDITERKRAMDQITHLARHDNLTGLPNRTVFVEELARAIALARRDGRSFAVLYLDLDHFKDVNDTLGHPVGDLLLQGVAMRLQAITREIDAVARFGGDEFAVLAREIGEPADAAALADKILKTLAEPFPIGGNAIRSGASVGIAVYGLDSPDVETLLSHADVALYRAKSEGRGIYRFFTEAMDKEVRTRVTLAAELRNAIALGQLFLMYQPQVDIDTDRIVGVEALVRWHHPERGMIAPAEFTQVAEKTGLIVAIGHWVLHEACRQMKEWLDAGIALPLIAVNMSGLQFKTPFELENDIMATLRETGLSPERLELELTETVFMETSREHNQVLIRLRAAGLRLAIDDFGTGYSSLEYLGRFPVDRVKIAQNFMVDLTLGSGNATIVKAAIGLAHDLGLDVIIEGVETAEQLRLVRSFGGHEVQGFYFCKPLPTDEATTVLRKGKISPAESVAIE